MIYYEPYHIFSNSRFLKSLELTNNHFENWKFGKKKKLIWGPPYDATIYINNILFHYMIQQKKKICLKFNKKIDPNHQAKKVQNELNKCSLLY
jgi:hypothetical protein